MQNKLIEELENRLAKFLHRNIDEDLLSEIKEEIIKEFQKRWEQKSIKPSSLKDLIEIDIENGNELTITVNIEVEHGSEDD